MPMTPKNWNSGDYTNDVKTAIVTEPCVLASVVLSNTLTDGPISFMTCLVDADNTLLAMIDIAEVAPNSTRVVPGRSLSIMSGQRLAFQASAQGGAVYATGIVSDSFNETDPRLQYATAAEVSQSIQAALEGYATNEGVQSAIDTALQNYQPETDMAAVQEAIDESVRALQEQVGAQSSAAICLIPNRQFDRVDENGVPAGWQVANAVASRSWHINHYDVMLSPTGAGIPALSTSIQNARFLGGKTLHMSADVSVNAGSGDNAIVAAANGRGAYVPARTERQTVGLDFTPQVSNPTTYSLEPSFSILPMTAATKRANMPSKRYAHMMTAAGRYVYVYGGRDDAFDWYDVNSAKSDLLRLDTQSGAWETLPSEGGPGRLSGGCMVHYDGSLYVFAGAINRQRSNVNDDPTLKKMWRYDLTAQTWEDMGVTPFILYWMAGAAGDGNMSGLLLAGGGYGVNGDQSTVYLYSVAARQWYNIGDMPYRGNNAGMIFQGGYVYLAGGYNNPNVFNYVYRGTIAGNDDNGYSISWERLSDMPTGRTSFGIAADPDGQRIFVYGGNTSSGIVASMDVLNIANGEWTTMQNTGAPQARFTCMSYVNGRLFTTGGYSGTIRLPDTWSIRTFRGLQPGYQFPVPDASFLTGGTTDAELIVGSPCLSEQQTIGQTVRLTRAQYDAMTSYDPHTHYIVQE